MLAYARCTLLVVPAYARLCPSMPVYARLCPSDSAPREAPGPLPVRCPVLPAPIGPRPHALDVFSHEGPALCRRAT